MEKKFVYVILFDYSTDDCDGIDLYIFDTKEKALKKIEYSYRTRKRIL